MTQAPSIAAGCTISSQDWGVVDGAPAHLWTLRNAAGMEAQVTDYGTIVVSLKVPDAKGQLADVVLGRPTVQDYVDRTQYFGCTAGRCANRIAKGQFTIDGESFTVATNNGANHLHGGVKGFDKVMWSGSGEVTSAGATLTLTSTSRDGDEGYPGEVKATVTYTLTPDNHFDVDMTATTNAPTVVNLAHHSYWNLAGQGSGDILGHTLMIPAARYTPVDSTLITTGEIESVEGTPLDFRTAKPIGRDIGGYPALTDDPGGYDHNLVLDRRPAFNGLWLSAVLTDPASGRTMEIWSNQPGIQFYSGNFLDGVPGKNGTTYNTLGALCLETQAFPDSINKQGAQGWPDVILRPGETYQHQMSHRFTAEPPAD